MQNLYPLFERNHILKKELLWALRDYSFGHAWLEYQEYGEGILNGCGIKIEGTQLVIAPGMIKYGGFLYLMTEEERINYGVPLWEDQDGSILPQQEAVLKMRLFQEKEDASYISYRMEAVLDGNKSLCENELELCRYRLQKGAQLRETYKTFEDMGTQYDVLDYTHASWGGLHGGSVSPALTRRFAEEILKTSQCRDIDIQFAYLCLNRTDAVPREILLDYIGRKNHKKPDRDISGEAIFREMCEALRTIGVSCAEQREKKPGKRTIWVE